MKITLDRLALQELIAKDKEFELELKANVLAEVGRRFFEKDSAKIIAAAHPEMFAMALEAFESQADVMRLTAQALTSSMTDKGQSYYNKLKLSNEVTDLIKTHVETTKTRAISDAVDEISNAFSKAINVAVEERMNITLIDDRINKRVDRLVNEEIDRRVTEVLKAKIAGINAALAS